ncbi:MAG: sigma-70 family RNA polymerase sigma factor [Vicinamibacterales bacterium]
MRTNATGGVGGTTTGTAPLPDGLKAVGRARAAQDDYTVRDELVMEHVTLVKTMAQRLAQRLPSQVEMNDLMSVGIIGLIDAAGRYKPSTGVPFEAFARRRIHGAMLDALRDLDWAPRSLRKLRRTIDSAIAKLRHELRREPEEHEIAEAMEMSAQEYDRALEQVRSLEVGALRQLDTAAPDGGSLLEICIDPDEGPEARLHREELKQHLASAIRELPERERQVLALYYQEELTMAEIGEVIGVGESRVSQLRSLAISRLRSSLRQTLSTAFHHYGDASRAARRPAG